MKKITKEELKTILEQHKLWLDSDGEKGKHANLTHADLSGANLSGANLSGANLYGAYLTFADLTGADLTCAYLYGACLYGANLTRANLYGADLINSDLEYSNLTDAILDEKEQCRKGIVLTASMIGYKNSNEGKIITLEIPIGAKVLSINKNKIRANKAKVIDMQGETELSSMYDTDFKYHVGDEIDIIDFDDNYNVECGEGIHFFLNIEDAENYEY